MGQYVWPCPGVTRISSPFGSRVPPTAGASSFHDGIDIAAAQGTQILAIGPGTVKVSGWVSGYGNYVKIQHSGGLESFYGHCRDTPLVKVGQSVRAGQKIAVVGSTGVSTGPHLHLGTHLLGEKVDPSNYVKPTDTLANYSGNKTTTKTTTAANGDTAVDNSALGAAINTEPVAYSGLLGALAEEKSKEITSVTLKSISGSAGKRTETLSGVDSGETGLELLIRNDQIYAPALEGKLTLERPRKGGPAVLKATVVRDGVLNFQEGNPVSLKYQGEKLFYGYVFTKSRKDERLIDITCYDQLRYLKNHDTLAYQNKTYTELLKMMAADYDLACGTLEDTSWKIESRIEECSLLDMLGNASDDTVVNTGHLFVLYDDFGELCLRDIQNMKLPLLIDAETARSYDYKSTIDENVYSRVKLAVDNSETGEREVHVYNSEEAQVRWGTLQYYEKLDNVDSAQLKARAQQLLKFYSEKQRSLKVTDAFGDTRVRGGSSLVVQLHLGDVAVQNYMVVEEVKHVWENGVYTMDLTLSGFREQYASSLPDLSTTYQAPDAEPEVTPGGGSWYSEDDLRIVATVIYNEAGNYCTQRHMELVGAVIYNRVRSSKFPNTVTGVVTQKNQYSPLYAQESSYYTQRAMAAANWQLCLTLAKKALEGQVECPANVLYQSNFSNLGSGYYATFSTIFGMTYFAYG